jgi:uncharacterized repeat protein (TIGR01451 family)
MVSEHHPVEKTSSSYSCRVGPALRRTLLVLACAMGAVPWAAASTKTWTGAASNLWSGIGNWVGGVPSAGDDIVFPAGAANKTNVNDLPAATVFDSIEVDDSGYALSGNPIGLASGIQGALGPNITFGLDVTLTAPQTFRGYHILYPLTVTGTITAGTNLLTLDGVEVASGGQITGSAGITATGTGALIVSSCPYSGTTTVNGSSRLLVAGAISNSQVVVNSGGSLGGAGVTGAVTTSGLIVPGQAVSSDPTGILTTGSISFGAGSSFYPLLNGAAPGTGYDQLAVVGSVTLSPGANFYPSLGFVPTLGQTFVVIANDGSDPVAGTFNGLGEGALITLNTNYQFQISYVGGDGNDIVLTCVLVPKTWTGASNALWSNGGNWLGGVPIAASTLVFPPGALNKTNVNDLTSGLTFNRIEIDDSNYSSSGNPIGLTSGVDATAGPNAALGMNLNLTAPQTLRGYHILYPLALGGVVSAGANLLTLDGVQIDPGGQIAGSGGVVVAGTGARIAGSCSYTGATTVNNGSRLLVDGAIASSSVAVNPGATLGGSGTVGSVATSGTVAPGMTIVADQVGILKTGSITFSSGSSLSIQLNGAAPGTGYDQLKVTGTVTLFSGTTLGVSLGFVPTLGGTYTIVDNDGGDFISGDFNGLPEGSVITLNSYYQFQLSYFGGDGNDIVLTCVAMPKTWIGAVNNLWSVAGNWAGGVPGTGDVIVFAAGSANKTNVNDLGAGITFDHIDINDSGYSISGNSIGLNAGINAVLGPNAGMGLNLTLTGPETLRGYHIGYPLDLTGTVSAGAFPLTLDGVRVAPGGQITGTGGVLVTGAGGSGAEIAGTCPYTGPTTVSSSGRLLVNGGLPNSQVAVNSGAILGGSGLVGPVVTSGPIVPGMSVWSDGPAVFTTRGITFNTGSSLSLQINGAVPGPGYDQLAVIGPITIGGGVGLNVTTTVPPSQNQKYVVVLNDGLDPVAGTFNGLPEGAALTIASYPFTISYLGKTGNDIVLTSQSGTVNTAPTAGIDLYTTPANTPLSVASPGVLANDSDPDSDPITITTFSPISSQGGSVVVNANGSFTYTPPVSFLGDDEFTYVITDGNNASDLGVVVIAVGVASTLTTISSHLPNPSLVGQSVTVAYSVTSLFGTPTGSVLVTDGTSSCSASVAAGSCSLTLAPAGPHSLTAQYFGDGTHAPSTSSSVLHIVDPVANLAITIGDAPDPVPPASTLTYTLTVFNAGPSDATSLTVVDTLPGSVTYQSVTALGWTCGEIGGVVTCTASGLLASTGSTITIVVVTGPTVGTPSNTATVAGSELDPNLADNTATATTAVAELTPKSLLVDARTGPGTLSNINGVLEPGETVQIEPAWHNPSSVALTASGLASSFVGPGGATYTLTDGTDGFGLVAPGSTVNCFYATTNCYVLGVSNPVLRPATHWDTTFLETLSTGETKTWTVHVGASFTDASPGYLLYTYVETLLHSGVTAGCTSTTYCPASQVSRAQMAMFIARALAGSDAAVPVTGVVPARGPYNCTTGGLSQFGDVAPTAQYCRHVHYIAAAGVTLGCGTGANFCPTPLVTRSDMARFVARAIAGSDAAVPMATTDPITLRSYDCGTLTPSLYFADIATSDTYCRHVHYLWSKDVVAGCAAGPPRYCPTSFVTRGQMAKFLVSGFGLTLY